MGDRTWSVRHDVREDAPSVFVPASALDGVDIGDRVEVSSSTPDAVRHGHVAGLVDDAERGPFVVVSFEPPNSDARIENAGPLPESPDLGTSTGEILSAFDATRDDR